MSSYQWGRDNSAQRVRIKTVQSIVNNSQKEFAWLLGAPVESSQQTIEIFY